VRLEIISLIPAGHARPTPLLFIHGMMHGAWCWEEHFLDYFAQQGFASHAVNLRGHGKSEGRERLRWTGISDFVDDVATAVQEMPLPPVLVGHSMGGFVIQKYLESHDAPGGVLLSSPSPAGLLGTVVRIARRHPLVVTRIAATFSLAPLLARPELAREAFYSENVREEKLLRYWRLMEEESFRALLDMVVLSRLEPAKVKTPLLVLGAARDHMLSRSDIEATARSHNTKPEIIPHVAHNSMLEEHWETVAERILAWLTERGF
jgi:pimeloyl-ACP methyl ester carboxylesterase